MAREVSVSSSEGRVAEWHDTIKEDGRRLTGVPKNADAALSKYNEHWIGEYKSDGEKFNEIFQSSVDAFNSRQNRPAKRMGPTSSKPERQKTYYEGIKDGTWCTGHDDTQEQPIYEAVLQMGNKDTLGTTDTEFDIDKWYELKTTGRENEASEYALAHLNQSVGMERAKRIIHRAVDRIATMDPEHLVVIRADWHNDEPCGTPNCHIAWTFRATGYKSGMKERTASVKALEQMGFSKSKTLGYGIEQLHERFKEIIAEEMEADAKEYGYEDDAFTRAPDSGEHRKRSDVDVFREMAAEREELDVRQAVLDWQESDIKRDRERLENTEKEQSEANVQLKRKAKMLQHMTGVIHKLMKDLGGERYKFQSIDDFASAFDEAKEKFITSVQEDADVKASDKVAAAFQVKEDQLEAQRIALAEKEDLVDSQMELSSPSGAALFALGEVQKKSSDPSVQRFVSFMMNYIKTNKNEINDGYETHIQEIRAKRQAIKFDGVAEVQHKEKEDQNSVSL